MVKKYYSTTEVSQILRVSRIAVFNRIKTGKLKAEKVGRNYIVHHNDLLEALGKSVGEEKKQNIDKALTRALHQYEETFKKLGRE